MKKIFYLMIGLATFTASAQVGVGVSSANVDASAQFEVASTNKGFLAPRMSEAQKNDIASPAAGLLVYQTDGTTGFYYYDGSAWKSGLGIQGLKGDTGLTGETGAKGATGETGPQGLQGIQGAQGETGAKGATGETGPQGVMGEMGSQGLQGLKGEQGPAGTPADLSDYATKLALDAETARAKSVELNFNDAISYNKNKSSYDIADVRSDISQETERAQNAEETLTTSVSDLSNIVSQIAIPDLSDYVTTSKLENVYYSLGQNYTELNSLIDEQKDKSTSLTTSVNVLTTNVESLQTSVQDLMAAGTQGPQGIQGAQGETGAKGTTGETGPQGIQGAQGETGAKGATGETGPQGLQGIQGKSGGLAWNNDRGYAAGEVVIYKGNTYICLLYNDGEPGNIVPLNTTYFAPYSLVGPKGDQGIQGEKGDTGAIGEQGIQGKKGDMGEKGEQGPEGIQGAQGETGAKGTTGETGPQGPAGSDAFKISTNNPNAIHNVNLGNVGIGTENPSYKIDIVGTSGPRLRVYSKDNYWAGIVAENSTHQYFMGVQHAGESANGTNSGFHIYDNTVGARRMVIDATGNMGIGVSEPTEKLVVAGNIKSNQSVMANSFVKADGTAAQYLMADGSVSTSTGGATVNEAADEFTAATSQSSFTLTQTPAATSRVKMYINGIRISNGAYGVNGTTVTYFPDYNGAYVITANDRIQFDYSY